MKYFETLLTAALLTLPLTAASAQGSVTPSFTAGTGPNESYMVVDFQDGTAHPSYLFGYKYEGSKTGLDMVEALDATSSPGVEYVPGFGPGDGAQFGVAINSFTYNGHSKAGFDFGGYWSYYLKDTGSWVYSTYGVSSRTLFNGSYDGWSWDDTNPDTSPAPNDPAAPAPEGSPVIPLGIGVTGIILSAAMKRKQVLSVYQTR